MALPSCTTDQSACSAFISSCTASGANGGTPPSQGSHFFQNLTSFHIAYFTTRHYKAEDTIDWAWLDSLDIVEETEYVRHVRAPHRLEILVDGQSGSGVVFKKERENGEISEEENE